MIKIQPIVRSIILGEPEACFALTNGYMNMSSYAHQIRPKVENLAKKKVTITSLVVSLSRIRGEFKKEKPLAQEVTIRGITTKLPLSEMVYENTKNSIDKLESIHKHISISREDFFTTTLGTSELMIVCSSNIVDKIIKHFNEKPKLVVKELASVGVTFDSKHFNEPNIIYSLILVLAKSRINIVEIVSTYSELIFIISLKDFSKTVDLLSVLHKKSIV